MEMRCDMCGKESNLFRTLVEGTELNVCSDCVKFGKKLGVAKTKQEKQEAIQKIIEENAIPETIEIILPAASRMIKQKRENMGFTQEQLAKKMNEKVSVIQQVENGNLSSIALVKKFERIMNLNLIKEYTENFDKKIKHEILF